MGRKFLNHGSHGWARMLAEEFSFANLVFPLRPCVKNPPSDFRPLTSVFWPPPSDLNCQFFQRIFGEKQFVLLKSGAASFLAALFFIMANEEPKPQQQVISLQAISQNFLGALQRQFDLLAYNLSASQLTEADKYEIFARQPRIMPVQQLHMNFGQVQAYARNLLVRQTINDLLSMSSACMDNCHLLCQLIKNQKEHAGDMEAMNKAVGEAQNNFVRVPLQDKFDLLEKGFGIMCELEDGLISMGIALRSLMTKDGAVEQEDLDDDGELVFEFKTVQTINPPKGEEEKKPEVRVVDTNRTFKLGDKLEFSNSELLGMSITIGHFFHQLFRSVDEYGRKTMGEQATPAPAPEAN